MFDMLLCHLQSQGHKKLGGFHSTSLAVTLDSSHLPLCCSLCNDDGEMTDLRCFLEAARVASLTVS